MKTVFDSNPEFSLTYTHRGMSVTLSGKVLLEAYLSTACSDQDNEQLLGLVAGNALPEAASQAAQLVKSFHSEFDKALAVNLTHDLLNSFAPPHTSDEKGNIIVKTKEKP